MRLLLKKLKTYFRKHKANKIITPAALALSLRFGEPRLTSSRSSSLNYESQVVVILNQKQESNSCDDSHNSGKVIQTGNGIILESQQEVSDANSNEILSEYNLNDPNEVILVKNNGTSIERLVTRGSSTAQQKLLLDVRGGENYAPEFIIKIILILTMSKNYKPTEGFKPKPIMNKHLGHLGQRQPNLRIAPKVREQDPLQAQNRPDRSQSQMSDITIKVEKEEVRFETPNNLNDRVQDASETKRIGKLKKDLDFTKKQTYRKYKHRFEYSNLDGSPISNKKEFREAQIRLIQDSNTYVSKAIHISKDHDPRHCYLFINDSTSQVIQANPDGDSLKYVGTRTFSKVDYDRFKRYGVIGEDWGRLKDVSFMRHGMSLKDLINHMNNNTGEL